MKEIIRQVVILAILMIMFLLALQWVDSIPEGTPGIYGTKEYTVYLTEHSTITNELPFYLFEDLEVVIDAE